MKNGFTLIELLAVIVILAIISLIAVPIVINIINDSKTISDEQSIELYLDAVEKTITKKQLSDQNFNPDKCKIMSNGNLECYKDNNKIETLQIEVKGTTPEKGIIELKDNKFIYKNILINGKYYYERGILVDDADNNNEISIGDKYTYKVNDTDTFNFYVLSFNEDETVNLIMDRNICGFEDANDTRNGNVVTENEKCPIGWDSIKEKNNNGPVTAMHGMYNATKEWKNVLDIDLSGTKAYIDEGVNTSNDIGYGKVETTNTGIKITKKDGTESKFIEYKNGKKLKARLPKFSEVTSEKTNCLVSTSNHVGCAAWLVDYLATSKNRITEIYGYWTLSSIEANVSDVQVVYYAGYMYPRDAGNSNDYGIRPVVTVSIDDLN